VAREWRRRRSQGDEWPHDHCLPRTDTSDDYTRPSPGPHADPAPRDHAEGWTTTTTTTTITTCTNYYYYYYYYYYCLGLKGTSDKHTRLVLDVFIDHFIV